MWTVHVVGTRINSPVTIDGVSKATVGVLSSKAALPSMAPMSVQSCTGWIPFRAKEVSESGVSAEESGDLLHSYRFSIEKLL
jgi:hypothetical protein